MPETPTQVRRPWRSTTRTVFQALIGLCVLAPLIISATGLTVAQLPWLGVVLAVAAAVTRIMAIPGVETWLSTYLPFLAAAPPSTEDERGAISWVEATVIILAVVVILILIGVVR